MLFELSTGGKEEEEEGGGGVVKNYRKHYARVLDPGLLLARRRREESTGRERSYRMWTCWNCFNQQYTEQAHENHVSFCHQNDCQKINMPSLGDVKSFYTQYNSHSKTFRSAYMLFYDFEALSVEPERVCSCTPEVLETTEIVSGKRGRRAREDLLLDIAMAQSEESGKKRPLPPPEVCTHKMRVLRDQPPFAYNYILMDREGKVHESRSYVGEDAADDFVQAVLLLQQRYLRDLEAGGVPMEELSEEQIAEGKRVENCYLCGEKFYVELALSWDGGEDRMVRDHDHLTGKFLGYAHERCNLQRRELITITAFAHNFSGYDSHFLVQAFHKHPELFGRIQAVPINTQKFKSFSIDRKLIFVDSLAFLSDSLANLAKMLTEEEFTLLDRIARTPEEKKLLLRKGIYPYSFATSIERLENATSLPPVSEFASDLTGEPCAPEDYEHARRVWERFGCSSMMDYTLLYMQTDVLLLAQVVQAFRNTVWEAFGLDLCQYLSLPHMAMDVMLKETGACIELMVDQEMVDLIRRNIRGGLSFVNLRRASRIPGDTVLMYFDANALYAHAMTHALPTGDYRWMTDEELAAFDALRDAREDGELGYILEVDLEYPPDLHLAHNSYPMAAETVDIMVEDLSPYSKRCLKHLKHRRGRKARKLTSTFRRRSSYLVHGLNLRLYLRHGLRLLALRRGIVFRQEPFVKPFIDKLAQMRREASTVTEQTMCKLYCNSVFGKFMEGVEKRMNCHFNVTGEGTVKNASSPLYKGFIICAEDLTITFHKKKEVTLNQSFAIGFSVLEISKYIMQSLFYDVLQPKFPPGTLSLVMSDTDSFLLALKARDETEVLRKLSRHMDFSNLPGDHELYSALNKKVPGLLKSEVPGSEILEVVALKSKCYSYKTSRGEVRNVAKGVTHAVKRQIPLEQYAACVDRMERREVVQRTIRSKDHVNQLLETKKVAFSSFDDKRYLTCAKHSVPYGSVLLEEEQEQEQEKSGGCYFCARPDKLY
jgi:hypothetical protein